MLSIPGDARATGVTRANAGWRSMKPDDAAKRLLEIASMVETSPDGRIFVERVNAVFLNEGGQAYEYRVGIELLERDGLINMHDTGTYFRLTEKGAQRFA
jgi:hypothetical protein